jgi:glutamyl-tRNA(Gln) amidotransferase subunit D
MDNYSEKLQKEFKKKGLKIGDRVILEKDNKRYEGILMPKSAGDPECIVIKLDNGYNIGISDGKISKAKEKKEKVVCKKTKKLKSDPNKPTIIILATGGTVVSKVDYKTGGVIPIVEPEELVEMIPELSEIANIKTKVVFSMLSENIEPEHWIILAKKIEEAIKNENVDGIIVTHGTDVMHYTSAALSFMLQDLPIPVLLVGSQRSSDRGSSDAAMNLICAARFIAKTDFSGVGICMHGSVNDDFCYIHNGTRVKKMHTSRRDTFQSIDVLPIAKVYYQPENIEFLRNDYIKKDKNRKVKLDAVFNKNVAIVKIRPGFSYKELEFYQNYDGLILEGTGLGHAPIESFDQYTEHHTELLNLLEKISKKIPVFMTSQCPYGRVNMNVYSSGRKLQKAGVIPCYMTTETAFVKLGWAAGHSKDKDEIIDIMNKNIAGEIARSDVRGFVSK